jgi:small subunit ribosomal protein S5
MADRATTLRPGTRRRTFAVGRGEQSEFDHEVLEVARVVRVVKGGRRFRFRAAVVVGDRSGRVGLGISKSKDVQQAIQKAQGQAVKNVVRVSLVEGTIAHAAIARFKGAHILLRPAPPGTGMIAGGTVRLVADMVGITDLVSKQFGSSNKINNARATIAGLASL